MSWNSALPAHMVHMDVFAGLMSDMGVKCDAYMYWKGRSQPPLYRQNEPLGQVGAKSECSLRRAAGQWLTCWQYFGAPHIAPQIKHLLRVTNASRVPRSTNFFELAHLKFSFVAPTSQAPTSERTVVNCHVMEPNLWPAARN